MGVESAGGAVGQGIEQEVLGLLGVFLFVDEAGLDAAAGLEKSPLHRGVDVHGPHHGLAVADLHQTHLGVGIAPGDLFITGDTGSGGDDVAGQGVESRPQAHIVSRAQHRDVVLVGITG